MDYARARSREGKFDEITREAWDKGYHDFTEEYGKLKFSTPGGWIMLNGTEEDLQALAKEDGHTMEEKFHWQARERDLTNYRFWATLCEVERMPEMVEARRLLYQGRQVWEEVGDATKANQLMLAGMEQFEHVITTFRKGYLLEQDEGLDFIEDAMEAVLRWQTVNAGRRLPDDYPLKSIFESTEQKYVDLKSQVQSRLATEIYGSTEF
jgi:hypothetical protein